MGTGTKCDTSAGKGVLRGVSTRYSVEKPSRDSALRIM